MKMINKITLLTTGGTIAKKYDELSGELVFDAGHIQKMFKQGRCTLPVETINLMLKDSLDMDDKDRDIIFDSVQKSSKSQIMITHGTDTMVETAQKLSTLLDKTIVLTGAMIPYAFKNSDAIFNLSFALAAVQTLPKGIYICMNAEIFSWDNVQKNRTKGLFETII